MPEIPHMPPGDGEERRTSAEGAYARGVEAGKLAQTVKELTTHQAMVNGSIERTGAALTVLTTEVRQLRFERDRTERLRTWAVPALAGVIGGLPAWVVLLISTGAHHA